MTKADLFQRGVQRIEQWCTHNDVLMPRIVESKEPVDFGTCAYYRNSVVVIHVPSCAHPGMNGRSWSYPGYVVDRTPYGVLAHELGHHVEEAHGERGGKIARQLRVATGEEAITTYAPNVNEWFAEIFRLFITNPDLLRLIRPKIFNQLVLRWNVVEDRSWEEVLQEAPRQKAAALNKIKQARRAYENHPIASREHQASHRG